MKKRGLLLAIVLVGLQAVWLVDGLAAPAPPLHVIHHENKQCAEVPGGDECADCYPPEGWEIVARVEEAWCPEGYVTVQGLDYACKPFKVSFCCSEGHSGAPGDCADLVVNDRKKQCAFVDDIQDCLLPDRWSARPESVAARDWVCPTRYDWVEDVICLSPTAQSARDTSDAPAGGLPCLGVLFMAPVGLGLWLVRKNRT